MSTPDPVAGLIRLLNIVGPQAPTTADALRPQLGSFNTGDYVPAHVLSTLQNGRFHVLVKDQLLDLNLPPNTEPGDTLQLKVERNDGRLQFSMPAPATAAPQPQPSAVSLSPAARLLQEALQRSQNDEPARVAGSQPLSSGAPQAAPLAENLRQAVRESGLFYESHQQQWVAGQKPLGELLREPQARLASPLLLDARAVTLDPARYAGLLSRISQASPEQLPGLLRELAQVVRQDAASAPAASTAPAPNTAAGSPPAAPDAAQPVRDSGLPSRAASAGQAVVADANANAEPGVDALADSRRQPVQASDLQRLMARPEMQNLVQQQIQVLETHHLLWQGQVWPGQDMDWEIVGEREAHTAADEHPNRWTSRLSLQLPNLGHIEARVHFSGGQVSLEWRAAEPATAEALRQNQLRLLQQMRDAQLTLVASHVDDAAPTPAAEPDHEQ